jgi:phage-related tail fiber protein
MLAAPDLMSRLDEVKTKTVEALQLSEADPGASVVLVAVVREFDTKATKANRRSDGASAARDAVIELEQAGDSAKAAAEADPGLGAAALDAVQAAHLAICILKTEV